MHRRVNQIEETWSSRLLPDLAGRFFRKTEQELAMVHAVPAALARNKRLVAIFQSRWNQHVSPGEALFAYRGAGAELVEEAQRAGFVPHSKIHEKEIFL